MVKFDQKSLKKYEFTIRERKLTEWSLLAVGSKVVKRRGGNTICSVKWEKDEPSMQKMISTFFSLSKKLSIDTFQEIKQVALQNYELEYRQKKLIAIFGIFGLS